MERELELEIDPDELWRAVSDADGLAGWLGEEVDVEVRPGGTGRVLDGETWRQVVVTDVDEGRRVAFVWWPEERAEEVSRVELVVLPAPAGSRLRVRETLGATVSARCAGLGAAVSARGGRLGSAVLALG